MKKSFWFIFVCILATACKQEPLSMPLVVSDIEIIDVGKIKGSFQLEIGNINQEQNVCQVKIASNDIRTDDKLDSINVSLTGNRIDICVFIDRYIYDEWWNIPDSCFTRHEIYFKLYGLQPDIYDINVMLDNMHTCVEGYEIK